MSSGHTSHTLHDGGTRTTSFTTNTRLVDIMPGLEIQVTRFNSPQEKLRRCDQWDRQHKWIGQLMLRKASNPWPAITN